MRVMGKRLLLLSSEMIGMIASLLEMLLLLLLLMVLRHLVLMQLTVRGLHDWR